MVAAADMPNSFLSLLFVLFLLFSPALLHLSLGSFSFFHRVAGAGGAENAVFPACFGGAACAALSLYAAFKTTSLLVLSGRPLLSLCIKRIYNVTLEQYNVIQQQEYVHIIQIYVVKVHYNVQYIRIYDIQ